LNLLRLYPLNYLSNLKQRFHQTRLPRMNFLQTGQFSGTINWMINSRGTLDGTGAFSNANPVNPDQPASFFRLRMP